MCQRVDFGWRHRFFFSLAQSRARYYLEILYHYRKHLYQQAKTAEFTGSLAEYTSNCSSNRYKHTVGTPTYTIYVLSTAQLHNQKCCIVTELYSVFCNYYPVVYSELYSLQCYCYPGVFSYRYIVSAASLSSKGIFYRDIWSCVSIIYGFFHSCVLHCVIIVQMCFQHLRGESCNSVTQVFLLQLLLTVKCLIICIAQMTNLRQQDL